MNAADKIAATAADLPDDRVDLAARLRELIAELVAEGAPDEDVARMRSAIDDVVRIEVLVLMSEDIRDSERLRAVTARLEALSRAVGAEIEGEFRGLREAIDILRAAGAKLGASTGGIA